MGVINHNAIIATTLNDEVADSLQKWLARRPKIGVCIHEPGVVIEADFVINGYRTFIMIPDGSNEGWQESGIGDEYRDNFIARLAEDDYEDGSSPWAWVEVGFGEYGQKVLRGNNKNKYNDKDYAE